jgi:hypothetical protein
VLIIVLISSFGKSKIFCLEAMQSLSFNCHSSVGSASDYGSKGRHFDALLGQDNFFFWIFIFFELFFKGVDGLWMGLKDVWSAWRGALKIKPFFLLDHQSHITYKASTLYTF